MQTPEIRFDDGASYEGFMGAWSRLAGEQFLSWLAAPAGWRWADVGCGNGAFTEMLVERCAPLHVEGIDPSESQIAFARPRLADAPIHLRIGDAMSLPYGDGTLDAAVMALVIFFVPEPMKAVAEMARVVRPGGSVSAYAWDIFGGGFPYAAVQDEMAALGTPALWPPSAEASQMAAMKALWSQAGLVGVRTHEIAVQRTFDDFDAFWQIAQTGPRMAPRIDAMAAADRQSLKDRLRARLPADRRGSITCRASANAIEGRVVRP